MVAFEQSRVVDALERMELAGRVFPADFDGLGAGLEHAHHAQRRAAGAREFVVTQQRTRLVVSRVHQRGDLGLCQLAFNGDIPDLLANGDGPRYLLIHVAACRRRGASPFAGNRDMSPLNHRSDVPDAFRVFAHAAVAGKRPHADGIEHGAAAPLLGLPIQRIDAILRLAIGREIGEHQERLAIGGQAVDDQPRVVGPAAIERTASGSSRASPRARDWPPRFRAADIHSPAAARPRPRSCRK